MTWSLLIKNAWGWNKTCPDNKVQIIHPLTCPPAGPWWLLDVLVSLRPSRSTGNKLIGKKKKKTIHDCLNEGAWERSRHQCGRLFSFFTLQNQQQLLQSLMWWAATHSDVHDGGPAWGQSPPSHHILVVAAVICREGMPAVLEVVAQYVVPVVLLL